MGLSVAVQTADEVSAASSGGHMVASSVTSFSPSAGSLVRICAGWLDATDQLGKTFTCADNHGNTYSIPSGAPGGDADGGCYLLVFDFVYSSAPGATTVSITASDNATADCLFQPYIITGQATSYAGAHNSFSEAGTSTTTYELALTPTAIGSEIFVLAAPNYNGGATGAVTPISGTTTDKDWQDGTVGSRATMGRSTSLTSSLTSTTYGWTSANPSPFGYGVMLLEVVPAGGGGGGATITRVQHNSTNPGTTATSLTATLGSGVASGNLLVATIVVGTNVGTITPPAGWQQAGPTESVTSNLQTQIFYLVVGTGGATSFVFSWSGSHSFGWTIEEWNSSTGWPANPVDVTAGAANGSGSTAVNCGSPGATTQAAELWSGVLSWANSGQTLSGVTAGWTTGDTSSFSGNNEQTAFYQVTTGTGTPSLAATISASELNAGVVATFKPVPLTVTYPDVPQIKPGPTWLNLFKPGLPRPRPQTVADRVNVRYGGLTIPLPTPTISFTANLGHQGSLAITLPVPAISFTAVQINPSDVNQINPGPAWLEYFKPGMPRPRPAIIPTLQINGGTLAIVLPVPIVSFTAQQINPSDVVQINPGPTWLELFKPGFPKPRPIQPFPSPPVEAGAQLAIPLPPLALALTGVKQYQGPLALVLPAPAIAVTATTINPRDVTQINPGPAWLEYFKPGLPRPRPAIVPTFIAEAGSLGIPLPTLVTSLTSVVQNLSDVAQIMPGPTWLGHFKPGLPKPKPLTGSNLFSVHTGGLVIILPPGQRSQLESGPLAIVLPPILLSLQVKRSYGRIAAIIRPPILSLTGAAQQTEQGVFNIVLPVSVLKLRGINGRETGTVTMTVPTVTVFLLAKVVHNGSLLIYMGGAAHLLTRYEMFGAETRTEVEIVLPGLSLQIDAQRTREKHPEGEIMGWLRAKHTRNLHRRQLREARARIVENRPRRAGEEELWLTRLILGLCQLTC